MTHFVLAMGRSGTMWTANALHLAAGLDSRHETVVKWEADAPFGDVEVNSFLWDHSNEIRRAFPGATLVHLARDGRDVCRSVMSRAKPGRTLETVCEDWRRRNRHLRSVVGTANRFRLEDLVSDFGAFSDMANLLGGYPQYREWQAIRTERTNRTKEYTFPAFNDWSKPNRNLFWKICGTEMKALGYER